MELRGSLRGRLKSNDKRVVSYTKQHDDDKKQHSSRLKKKMSSSSLSYNSDQVNDKNHDGVAFCSSELDGGSNDSRGVSAGGDGSAGSGDGSSARNNFWEMMRSLKENSSDAMNAYMRLEDLQALRDRLFQSIDGLEIIEDYSRNASNYNITDDDNGIVYKGGGIDGHSHYSLRQDFNDGLKENEAKVVSLRGDVQVATDSVSSLRATSFKDEEDDDDN